MSCKGSDLGDTVQISEHFEIEQRVLQAYDRSVV